MFTLWLVVTAAAAGASFVATRSFVKRRLRFIDAVQRPAAPVVAGIAAAAVALPVAGLLPVVTATTAVLVGAGVAAGVASGRRDRSGA